MPPPAPRHAVIPVASLHRLLTELPGCVVLRSHDVVANLRGGGDIDLLVSDLDAAERHVHDVLGAPLVISRRSYVVEYVYDWGRIDLASTVEWRGAPYLEARTLREQAHKSSDGLTRPRPAHEALICWFSSLLWGGFFKARYEDIIVRAAREDREAFRAACVGAAGERWGERLRTTATAGRPSESVKWAKALRRIVWWRAFRRDLLGTIRRYAMFWIREIGLRRSPPLPSFAVLGADGSGKSSVLAAIVDRFGPPLSAGVVVCHWRPGRLAARSENRGPVTDPHGKPPRGPLASVIKLGFLFVDWTIGYWGDLVHRRAKGYLLTYDRHYVDIYVDPLRYRYGGPRWLAALVGSAVPAADVLIVLDAPVSTLRERKQEVTEKETVRQRSAYRELAKRTRHSYTIDASMPLDQVVDAVERVILDCIAQRTSEAMQREGHPTQRGGEPTSPVVTSGPSRSAASMRRSNDAETRRFGHSRVD